MICGQTTTPWQHQHEHDQCGHWENNHQRMFEEKLRLALCFCMELVAKAASRHKDVAFRDEQWNWHFET
jgi:hypothetical protein